MHSGQIARFSETLLVDGKREGVWEYPDEIQSEKVGERTACQVFRSAVYQLVLEVVVS